MHRIFRNRVFLGLDILFWAFTPALALSLRLDGFGTISEYVPHLIVFTIIAMILKVLILWRLGLYRRYWRYASVDELILIVASVILAGAAVTALYFSGAALEWWGGASRLPRSVPVIDTLLTLFLVGGTRFSGRATHRVQQRLQGNPGGEPVLIVGAGDGGAMIVKELHANPQLLLDPIGFIDDDPLKRNRTILGLPILGDRREIPRIAEQYGARAAIIAMSRAPGHVIREIRNVCEDAGLPIKIIPGVYEIISGRVKVNQLRDVEIEDLLRREPVVTDQAAAAELVRGKRVLVTGAGGSIGSEICRQVARHGVREVILLGHGENPIFDIHNELARRYPELSAVPIIADIRDVERIERVFATHRPEVVFHAAAHKHVPLMEMNPEEAITNNVAGTVSVVSGAERVGVERFVFISTDKAVNPINMMGATKLLAEMLVHDAALRTGAPYVSVRFGNVLASRGSVVPLFKEQIAAGGPVTVTHPEMCRYFMTIPEAVQLVLQAAALGKGGETFLLDMGQPVKILDLARDLIQLSGLEVGQDIDIAFTGLRPGEKLFEELYSGVEEFTTTVHEKVFVVRNGSAPQVAGSWLARIFAAARAGDGPRLRQVLSRIVPAYAARVGGVEPVESAAVENAELAQPAVRPSGDAWSATGS